MAYSVLTPYIIPSEKRKKKKTNIGDGFILHRILQFLAPIECRHIYSSRQNLSDVDIRAINNTKALILAGTNQLTDNFTIVPGMTIRRLNEIKVPIIPFGMGISGHLEQNRRMSSITKAMLEEIHTRIPYSSWRCNRSINYLIQQVPAIQHKLLLTGCPVVYGNNLLSGVPFSERTGKIVVTVTERDDFWDREVKTLDFVADRFKASHKILSLHQVFDGPTVWSLLRAFTGRRKIHQYKKRVSALREYALKKGFDIFYPRDAISCMDFYNTCDLHIGSRLHAHLYFLSQAKKSFLTYVDDRCVGFAETFKFPLCNYTNFDQHMGYDFEIYRACALSYFEVMKKFILHVKMQIM